MEDLHYCSKCFHKNAVETAIFTTVILDFIHLMANLRNTESWNNLSGVTYGVYLDI